MSDTMKKFQDYFDALDDLKQTAKRADNNEASDDDVRASFAHVTSFYRMSDAASARDVTITLSREDADKLYWRLNDSEDENPYVDRVIAALAVQLNALSAPAAPAADAKLEAAFNRGVFSAFAADWDHPSMDVYNDVEAAPAADAGTGENVIPIRPERHLGHCAEAHLKWGAINQDDLMDAEFGPKEDSLEAAIAECEANGWKWGVDCFFGGERPVGVVRKTIDGFDGAKAWKVIEQFGDTPILALRAAMSRAAGSQDGWEG